ncbi:MAG: UDP-N-acetylmuramoyl-tripeptide--D-alanyl-D-alanine ligase [Lachnospiraceae bacterium]|nr:UDP-N-acetylmuramoyl-tripeptide--D-alanyl-D-alanine ligase [Lachnospiraceae bacterium]
MKNLTIQKICKACDGTLYGTEWVKDETKEALGVVLDSRLLQEGFVFVATKGEKVDGHKFIPSVFEKGAMAVICEEVPTVITGPCIQVEDSFVALKKLAAFYREQLDITVVGITGSVGKTSTKEFVAGVLSTKYRVWKTQGNFNNEVGLPLTVLQLRDEHEIAVLEMGISDFGEMHRLSEIAKPDICVLTNIGQCHLEFLGDRDGVLKAKSEIFDFMNPEGMIFVNGDDDKLITLKETWKERLVTFGREENNDVIACNEVSKGLLGSTLDMVGMVDISKVQIPLPGEHMVLNALAAAAVAKHLQLSKEEILEGVKNVKAVSGRSNIIPYENFVLIDDCYNANPVSMKAAIDLLQSANGRKIAVLGDMFELGEDEQMLHYEVGSYAKGKIDFLICIGNLAEHIYEGGVEDKADSMSLLYLPEKEDVYQHLQEIIQPQDTILLKASHGMGFADIVAWFERNYLKQEIDS